MKNLSELEKILLDIEIENINNFNFVAFEDLIKSKMPDYEIYTWDYDDYSQGDMTASVVNTITSYIKNGVAIADIQHEQWATQNCDCYVYVLAIKFKN